MSTSALQIKRCKLAPTVTVLCTSNFTCKIVRTKPYYVHKNQCTQISNLSSSDTMEVKNVILWSAQGLVRSNKVSLA